MKLKAYAKINWSLEVTGTRSDGYHELEMVMQRIALCDVVTLRPMDELRLSVRGCPEIPGGPENLAFRAARLLRETAGIRAGADIALDKAIPAGAGLGGGSADAAAVIKGLNRLWNLGYTAARLAEIGLKIGADVPYCLEREAARVTGIGERIETFPVSGTLWLVIIQPRGRSLSTREVFDRFSQDPPRQTAARTPDVIRALQRKDLGLLRRSAGNRLQETAASLFPEITLAAEALLKAGAPFAQMSGSGSAVFGAFESRKRAEAAFSALCGWGPALYLTRTLPTFRQPTAYRQAPSSG